MERRDLSAARARIQLREKDGKPVIEGYGAVFYSATDPGTEYELWRDVYERVLPGAFDRALREDDVRSLFNHDSNFVLGRNRGATAGLELSVDKIGLRYQVTPPDTQLIRDAVLEPIRRGDVDGSSFMFLVRSAAWVSEDRGGRQIEVREIREVELWETGPVVFPAYGSTTAGVRAARQDLDLVRTENEEWKRATRSGRISEVDAWVKVRMAMLRASRGR